ncbi:hypothetical protein [Halorarius halobius]|uniref:hypothetical protein n=1 Tax=Halorarius halobius TaxID=2962671 RepID=UPI0020CD485E|nr:hypothetical protein [Halorarius halobius]
MVSPRPLYVALLVGCLLVAGCSGTPVSSDSPSPEPVTSPAPVPNGTSTPEALAPGLTRGGVVDAERLSGAHDAYLRNRSHRRTIRTVYRFSNGTVLYARTFTHRESPTADRRLFVYDVSGHRLPPDSPHFTSHTEWMNETLKLVRLVNDDAVHYRRDEAREYPNRGRGGSVARFLADQDPRVAGKRQANGTTEYVLVARDIEDVRKQVNVTVTGDYRLVAVVTREGLVRSMRVTAEGRYRGAPVRLRTAFVVTDVGNVSVGRPAWLTEALNATRSADEDPTFVDQPTTTVTVTPADS